MKRRETGRAIEIQQVPRNGNAARGPSQSEIPDRMLNV